MSHLKRLIVEIHRRSLWQVLAVHCFAAIAAAKSSHSEMPVAILSF
jgi:hypothetical protein